MEIGNTFLKRTYIKEMKRTMQFLSKVSFDKNQLNFIYEYQQFITGTSTQPLCGINSENNLIAEAYNPDCFTYFYLNVISIQMRVSKKYITLLLFTSHYLQNAHINYILIVV